MEFNQSYEPGDPFLLDLENAKWNPEERVALFRLKNDHGVQRYPPVRTPVDKSSQEITELGKILVDWHNDRNYGSDSKLVFVRVTNAIQEGAFGLLYDLTVDVEVMVKSIDKQASSSLVQHSQSPNTIQRMVWKGMSRQFNVPKKNFARLEKYGECLNDTNGILIESLARESLKDHYDRGELFGKNGEPLLLKTVISSMVCQSKGYYTTVTTYRLNIETNEHSQLEVVILDREWVVVLDEETSRHFCDRKVIPPPIVSSYSLPSHTQTQRTCTNLGLHPKKDLRSQRVLSTEIELDQVDLISPYIFTAAKIAVDDRNLIEKHDFLELAAVVKASHKVVAGIIFNFTLEVKGMNQAKGVGPWRFVKTEVYTRGWRNYFRATPFSYTYSTSERSIEPGVAYLPRSKRLQSVHKKKLEEEESS